MFSWWERLHTNLVLVVDVQQPRDDGGNATRRSSLSRVEEDCMLANAMTTGVQQTHGQIAPLSAVLEDPKTPVFDETGHLVPRGVTRPEALFHGQTCFLRAEWYDILLFSDVNKMVLETYTRGDETTYLANPFGIVQKSNIYV